MTLAYRADFFVFRRRRHLIGIVFPGKLRYRAEDYIVIPRGITYRLVPDKVEEEDYLILESAGPVRIPKRYLNREGQIKMGAPYSERDFHGPTEILTIDKEEDVDVLVKDGGRFTRVTMAHHPFDVVGWDGYFIRSRSTRRISSRSPARCISRRRFIRRSRFAVTSSLHIRAAIARYASGGGENSVGARQRRSGRSFVLRARKFRIAPRHRAGVDHLASARHSARAASGHDHGEQGCRTRTEELAVMFDTQHARADRGGGEARRRQISVELARLG